VEEDKTFNGKQWRCKHVSAAAEAQIKVEELLEAVHPKAIHCGPKWRGSQWWQDTAMSEWPGVVAMKSCCETVAGQ
jgi:hypothetical protein